MPEGPEKTTKVASKQSPKTFLSLPSEIRQSVLFQTYDDPAAYYHEQWGQYGRKPPWHYDYRLCIRDFETWMRDVQKVDERLNEDVDWATQKWMKIYDDVCEREELPIFMGTEYGRQ